MVGIFPDRPAIIGAATAARREQQEAAYRTVVAR